VSTAPGPQARSLFDALADAPAAFARGLAGARVVALPFPGEAVRNVAVCGVGSSASAGALVAGACSERILVPVTVESGYTLPGWVGEDTLVVLLSASGADEETLTCTSLATERNALCVAVTGGGKLGTAYADEGVPVVPVPADGPAGGAMYELMGALVGLLERLGVMPMQPGELDEAHEVLQSAVAASAPAVPADANPGLQVARALDGAIPMVWGGELTAPVARHWVAQIRLHAKVPAFASELPQMNRDELMAFSGMPAELASRARLVLLRDARQQRQVQRRFEHTAAVVAEYVPGQLQIAADGRGPLARMLDLTALGDHVALHLAALRGVDAGAGAIAGVLAERLATTGMGRTAGHSG
jgi:glucose/mannose-6-phosphate isomerase